MSASLNLNYQILPLSLSTLSQIRQRTTHYSTGAVWEKSWSDSDDNEHKTDGPAIIRYYENGCVMAEVWMKIGTRTRSMGPAYTTYYQNGHKKLEMWYLDGKLSRLFNNSVYRYKENGELDYAHWSSSDMLRVLFLIVSVSAIICIGVSLFITTN